MTSFVFQSLLNPAETNLTVENSHYNLGIINLKARLEIHKCVEIFDLQLVNFIVIQ